MMKQHKLVCRLAAAALAAAVFASCGEEPRMPEDPAGAQSLMISPSLLDLKDNSFSTRAITEEDLADNLFNENTVSRLDVFFFEGETLAAAYHIDKDKLSVESHSGKTGYLLSKDWKKDGLKKGIAYSVYVVANSTDETVSGVTSGVTVADLQALVRTEGDIYKRQGLSDDNTYTTSKSFLMNASVDSWTITAEGTQLVNDDTVTLTRAAVKFVMEVSLSDEFAKRLEDAGQQYGAPSWKYVNFNTVTAEVPGGAAPAAVLKAGGSGMYLSVEQGETEGQYKVVTYAYPQAWTAETAPDSAPAIFLSFPSRPIGNASASPAYHYYYIPLCSNDVTQTVSNNLYKVSATISSFGSSEAITSDPVSLTYEVMPWGSSYEADIEATALDYLLATPKTYSFKGGQEGVALSTTIRYYASGAVTVSDVKGYYVDKNGTTQTVASGSGTFTVSDPSNGVITVSSVVPTNGTFRSIEFTVTCGSLSQVVKIRHYPLDFVTAEDGAYATYNDDSWVNYGSAGTYIASGVNNNRFTYFTSNPDSYCFGSKVFYNNNTYYMTTAGGRGDRRTQGANNQMYVLQLTSANDKYVLGRPALNQYSGDVYAGNTRLKSISYYLSDDDVISPAFMLGSQLASLGSNDRFSTVAFAAMHCALYKEVANGVSYTGWRLPTKQEINYMIENQNSDAMVQVLSALKYWALNGEEVSNSAYTAGNYTSVRCVRDLSAEELAKINKFE